MFGTYEKFNLVRCAFARHASNTYIQEDYYKRGLLRLGNNWIGESVNSTDFLFDMKLTVGGTPVKYTYFADEGSLTMTAGGARVDIALTDRSHFRIRGKGAGLRLELRSASGNGAAACRGIYALPDGSGWEGEFGRFGKLFFRAISGNYTVTSVFDDEKNAYSLVRIDFMPDITTGVFEAAVHDYRDRRPDFGEYEDFDVLVESNRADLAEFGKIYREPAPGYEELSNTPAGLSGLIGRRPSAFKEPMILFQNSWTSVVA